MKVYYAQDADVGLIKGKKVAILGYGSQGRAHALNLRDSGVGNVVIGLKEGSPSRNRVETDGLKTTSVAEAVRSAELVMVLTPDEVQPDLYREQIEPNIRKEAALAFAHGFGIHFGLIAPRADLDVIMCAPKGPGHTVRAEYERGAGVPAIIAIDKDVSGNAHELALSYACAVGAGKSGIIETTFAEETETDLFGEQAVLCGGLSHLILAAYETLVEAGYAPEMAYFECLHEVKLIADLIYEGGLATMRYSVSNTAEYGDYTGGPVIVDQHVKENMKKMLENIRSGQFARSWMIENSIGQPFFKAARRRGRDHQIEEVGQRLRKMMPWIHENRLVRD